VDITVVDETEVVLAVRVVRLVEVIEGANLAEQGFSSGRPPRLRR
jgi:hypothetical protein